MYKYDKLDIIKSLETEKTIDMVGKIDVFYLRKWERDSVYYIFPLIEKMLLEIFKVHHFSDVEHYAQGMMRTPKEFILASPNILHDEIGVIILKYFDEDGIRNKLFHGFENVIINLEVLDELHKLIVVLLIHIRNSDEGIDDFYLVEHL